MLEFKTLQDYLAALRGDASLAVISKTMVAKMLGLRKASIEQRIARGRLEGIKIYDGVHVRASSVIDFLDKKESQIQTTIAMIEEAARKRETISYGPIMSAIGLDHHISPDRATMGVILGEISTRTFMQDDILLSALVVRKNDGMPSEGFFSLHENLRERTVKNEDKVFEKERDRVFAHYA